MASGSGSIFARVKANRWNVQAAIRALGKVRQEAASHWAGTVRVQMKKLLNKDPGSYSVYSKPGSPPFKHHGLLQLGVQFKFDERSVSYVVGPELRRDKAASRMGGPPVPQLLNQGGVAPRRVPRRGMPRDLWPIVQATYPARPFALPALKRSLNHPFAADWQNKLNSRWAGLGVPMPT